MELSPCQEAVYHAPETTENALPLVSVTKQESGQEGRPLLLRPQNGAQLEKKTASLPMQQPVWSIRSSYIEHTCIAQVAVLQCDTK